MANRATSWFSSPIFSRLLEHTQRRDGFGLESTDAFGYAYRASMVHKIAKLMLEQAGTFLERAEAIRTALSLGMPLGEIEEYLDWLDAIRGPLSDTPEEGPVDEE